MPRRKRETVAATEVVGAVVGRATENLPAIAVPQVPMEASPDGFAGGLLLRQQNRQELLKWVRDNLVEDRDYGHIRGKNGQVLSAVPSLWQPGAQQICGLLGLRATFPDAEKYVDKAVRGEKIEQVVVRCVLLNSNGEVVAEGMGARSAVKIVGEWKTVNGQRERVGDRVDYDLNYALKMAQKSAHIDATLRAGGLSAIFTQDLSEEEGSAEERDDSTLEAHPAELKYLEAKAEELFGERAKDVLTALAMRRMRVADGDYSKIKRRLLDYCIKALEERASADASAE